MPKLNQNVEKTTQTMEKLVDKGSENRRAELERGLVDVQNKERALNSRKAIDDNKLKETKHKLIRELFRMMEELGVDPNDLTSINNFLSNLEEQNPDLVELFRVSFDALTSDSDIVPTAPEPETEFEDAGLMGKFRNLGSETFRPRQNVD